MLSTVLWSYSYTTSKVKPDSSGIGIATPVILSEQAICYTQKAQSAPQFWCDIDLRCSVHARESSGILTMSCERDSPKEKAYFSLSLFHGL